MLTDWRRLPYLDPGLPAELLPDGWIGIRAADLFFALRSLLEEPARAYVKHVIWPAPHHRGLTTAMPWISTSAAGSHSRVTPTPAMAGYPVPASRRQTAPISRPCDW